MNNWEAFILGILQGLTEFLPVSSSGHIELGKALLGVEIKDDILFSVIVHAATSLSTLIVFRKEIATLILNIFSKQRNESHTYVLLLFLSMIPVGMIGLPFEKHIETLFESNVVLVGSMLCLTSLLLFYADKPRENLKKIGVREALGMGVAQAIAIVPGISRSGATISAALMLGVKKEEAARFSFLMSLAPILGATFLKVLKSYKTGAFSESTEMYIPMLIGFFAAFIAGVWACSFMVSLVKKGSLKPFAIYCLLIGSIAITVSLLK